MKASDFKPGQEVVYVPMHAKGDLSHRDAEVGTVSSVNEISVFVRFRRGVMGCYPWTLQFNHPGGAPADDHPGQPVDYDYGNSSRFQPPPKAGGDG